MNEERMFIQIMSDSEKGLFKSNIKFCSYYVFCVQSGIQIKFNIVTQQQGLGFQVLKWCYLETQPHLSEMMLELFNILIAKISSSLTRKTILFPQKFAEAYNTYQQLDSLGIPGLCFRGFPTNKLKLHIWEITFNPFRTNFLRWMQGAGLLLLHHPQETPQAGISKYTQEIETWRRLVFYMVQNQNESLPR